MLTHRDEKNEEKTKLLKDAESDLLWKRAFWKACIVSCSYTQKVCIIFSYLSLVKSIT